MTRVDPRWVPDRQAHTAHVGPGYGTPAHIIVGIGHEFRRDDAVGLVVARRIQAEDHDGVTVLCLGEDLLKLLDAMQPDAQIVVVDAVVSGAPAGTIHCVDLLQAGQGRQIPATSSSHTLDMGQVLSMAHALERAPAALWLVGVEAGDLSTGAGLSPPVAAAVEAAVVVAHDRLAWSPCAA